MYTVVSGTYDIHEYGTGYDNWFDAANVPCGIPTSVSEAVRVAETAMRTAQYSDESSHDLFRSVSSVSDVDYMTSRVDAASTLLGRFDTFHVSNRDACLINASIPDIVYGDVDELGEDTYVNQNDFDLKHNLDMGTAAHYCLKECYWEHHRATEFSDDPLDFIRPTGEVPLRLIRRVTSGGLIIVAEFAVGRPDININGVVARVTLVLQPRGWGRVRHVLRVRSIVVYWLFLTETLMAPGGSARKRDRDVYEAEE
jgi:hypothetical protein